jgi:hypothetical protein
MMNYRDIERELLSQAESAIAVGELLVLRQRSRVSELARDSHDREGAEMVLAALEKSHKAQIAIRDRLLEAKIHSIPTIRSQS